MNDSVKSLLDTFRKFKKEAFQPSPMPAPPQQGAPMDPAAAQGGMPPQGPPPGAGAPMPPQGGPPVDPATGAPAGGPPAGGIPPELEQMLSELAGGIQQLSGVVQELQQNQQNSSQQSMQFQQELAQLKSSLTRPAPMEGGGMM